MSNNGVALLQYTAQNVRSKKDQQPEIVRNSRCSGIQLQMKPQMPCVSLCLFCSISFGSQYELDAAILGGTADLGDLSTLTRREGRRQKYR